MNRSLFKIDHVAVLSWRKKIPAVYRLSSTFHNFLKLWLQQSWLILLGKPALFWKNVNLFKREKKMMALCGVNTKLDKKQDLSLLPWGETKQFFTKLNHTLGSWYDWFLPVPHSILFVLFLFFLNNCQSKRQVNIYLYHFIPFKTSSPKALNSTQMKVHDDS